MCESKSIAYGMDSGRGGLCRAEKRKTRLCKTKRNYAPTGFLRFKSVGVFFFFIFEFRTREFFTDRTGKGLKSSTGGGLSKTVFYFILIIYTNPARSRDYRLSVVRLFVSVSGLWRIFIVTSAKKNPKKKNNKIMRPGDIIIRTGGRSSSSISRRGSLFVRLRSPHGGNPRGYRQDF